MRKCFYEYLEISWRRERDVWIQLKKTGSAGGENAKEFVELLKLQKNGKTLVHADKGMQLQAS